MPGLGRHLKPQDHHLSLKCLSRSCKIRGLHDQFDNFVPRKPKGSLLFLGDLTLKTPTAFFLHFMNSYGLFKLLFPALHEHKTNPSNSHF